MYILNERGPRMEPWGTPKNISVQELYEEFIFALCFFPVRYE